MKRRGKISPRRPFGKKGNVRQRQRGMGQWLLAAGLGVSLALWCIVTLTARLSPALSSLARAQAERRVSEAAVRCIQTALAAADGPLVTLEQDETGRATALKADTAALNQVRDELLRTLNGELEGLRREKVGVPLGSLTSWRSLYGVGPEVKVGIYAAPVVTSEFSSHFSQAGVNQTRHVIELEVTVTLQLLLPAGMETLEVKTTAPVAETVIVGTPPEEYLQAGT